VHERRRQRNFSVIWVTGAIQGAGECRRQVTSA
jgi:hypothetical protein